MCNHRNHVQAAATSSWSCAGPGTSPSPTPPPQCIRMLPADPAAPKGLGTRVPFPSPQALGGASAAVSPGQQERLVVPGVWFLGAGSRQLRHKTYSSLTKPPQDNQKTKTLRCIPDCSLPVSTSYHWGIFCFGGLFLRQGLPIWFALALKSLYSWELSEAAQVSTLEMKWV